MVSASDRIFGDISRLKKSLSNNNSKFVEFCTKFTVEVLKERLDFFENSNDVSIVGDLCKYMINDFMEYMLHNGKDRELSIDELEDIYHKTAQRFLAEVKRRARVDWSENSHIHKMYGFRKPEWDIYEYKP